MKKELMKISAFMCAVTFILPGMVAPSQVLAEESDDSGDTVELIENVESEEEEEVELDDISDDELLEAEPSDLPDEDEDEGLTRRMYGRMLLDVEGNGEVYYVDPVTGGKEYLADGESAQLLLRRRALGINEENFAELILGEEKDDASVCEESELGNRLKGRIVLRTEENGEAYWILPTNCRAYYAGTFEASYELMKKFSLGITKKNLAKIRNNKRQNIKSAFRLSVYAQMEDNDMTLEEAREALKGEVQKIRTCMADFRATNEGKPTKGENKERVITCVQNSEMPKIDLERRQELRGIIKEKRQARIIDEATEVAEEGEEDVVVEEGNDEGEEGSEEEGTEEESEDGNEEEGETEEGDGEEE